ncbi:MAG: hypothetical protein J3K34DRAFT_432270 [Monoraphidium minutum]|nr:MAG: hypothetical protein J3K34DRAFT_432270 [Monoraphidium minutum]
MRRMPTGAARSHRFLHVKSCLATFHQSTQLLSADPNRSAVAMMRGALIALALCGLCLVVAAQAKTEKEVTSLQIGVKFKPEGCDDARKAKPGDTVAVHYAGRLVDGTEFDNSFTRGEPITFELGKGRVIKGWDQGINGMCVGEKRKLKIPPHLGYGDAGAGPTIPGKATLIFDTELVKIE